METLDGVADCEGSGRRDPAINQPQSAARLVASVHRAVRACVLCGEARRDRCCG